MWIVELALRRPYTFVVIAMLIAIMSSIFMFVTPKDIFPNINIPIISVIWQYNGLPAEEFSERYLKVSTEADRTKLVTTAPPITMGFTRGL